MWLPTPFYERAPQYWLVLGLLFIIVGTYLGIEVDRSYLFLGIGVGLACCAWSARVFSQRSERRRKNREANVDNQGQNP